MNTTACIGEVFLCGIKQMTCASGVQDAGRQVGATASKKVKQTNIKSPPKGIKTVHQKPTQNPFVVFLFHRRCCAMPQPQPQPQSARAVLLLSALLLLLLLPFGSGLTVAGAPGGGLLYVVNITNEPLPTQVAVQVCAGLFNRNTSANASTAYTLLAHPDYDEFWLSVVQNTSRPPLPTPTYVSPAQFLAACLAASGPAAGARLRWNATAQKAVAPELLTVAAVLDAVPLEDGDPAAVGTRIVFDAVERWAGFNESDAVQYIFNHYINATTGMAMMDPGYGDQRQHPFRPPITGHLDPGLIDYIVGARLFNFFLYQGCVPDTPEHGLFAAIANHSGWPRPLAVLGYNDAYPVAGDLFEAETLCTRAHNLGQISTWGVNNLAFFSRFPPVTTPLPQNPPVNVSGYSSNRTYITLVVGDGDSIGDVRGPRRQWMSTRVASCQANYSLCYPLVWSFSPHPAHFAPVFTRWFFLQSHLTGRDYFMLPPSGHLYSYPGMIRDDAAQWQYVNATEADAQLYSTDATVDWEWFTAWRQSFENYYPKYAVHGIIRGVFPVNVPYMFPVGEFSKGEFYKIVGKSKSNIREAASSDGGGTVVFRPREWRGPSGGNNFTHPEYKSVAEMAAEVNDYPRGTVTFIYMTSDGGANLTDYDGLVANLLPHVSVVDHSTLIDMALAAEKLLQEK